MLFTIVDRYVGDAKVEQKADQLLFAVRYACLTLKIR